MLTPGPTPDEAERLAALQRCGVLDTEAEPDFDSLVELAAKIAGTPIALVSLVDAERQWFKARVGLGARETPRAVAFCAHAVHAPAEAFVVRDARVDPRFADNPLVTGEPRVIFYAGIPLRVGEGRHAVGTLCVIDHEPRALTPVQLEKLQLVARQVELLLEVRRRQRDLEGLLATQERQEARTRAILAAMNGGLVVQARGGAIESCNPAAEEILGLTADQMRGRTSLDPRWRAVRADGAPFPGEEHPAMVTLRTGAPMHGVIMGVGVSDAARRWILINSEPVGAGPDGLPESVVTTFTDITRLREHEAALEAAREAAERADRAKSTFLATMSHEIRTPLNGVLGLAEVLEGTALDAEQRSLLATLRGSGRSLLAIINDILDWSRIQSGHMDVHLEAVALASAAREVVEALRPRTPDRRVAVEVIDEAPGAYAAADPQRLRQVLTNLVGNALKFTEEGRVTVRLQGDATRCVVSIEDTGIGIPASELPRLFTRFTQVDDSNARRFGGTGLGLAISKQLVTAMGGALTVSSTVGLGSTFSLVLERAAPEPNGAVASTAATADASARPLRLLLAEDNPVNQRVATLLLRALGHSVTVVGDGRAVLDAELAEIDAILMDVQMPEVDGLEATQRLRLRAAESGERRVPILALTASALEEERAACFAAGMDGVLTKPITADTLRAGLAGLSGP